MPQRYDHILLEMYEETKERGAEKLLNIIHDYLPALSKVIDKRGREMTHRTGCVGTLSASVQLSEFMKRNKLKFS